MKSTELVWNDVGLALTGSADRETGDWLARSFHESHDAHGSGDRRGSAVHRADRRMELTLFNSVRRRQRELPDRHRRKSDRSCRHRVVLYRRNRGKRLRRCLALQPETDDAGSPR